MSTVSIRIAHVGQRGRPIGKSSDLSLTGHEPKGGRFFNSVCSVAETHMQKLVGTKA
jgi:hypothetical protein